METGVSEKDRKRYLTADERRHTQTKYYTAEIAESAKRI